MSIFYRAVPRIKLGIALLSLTVAVGCGRGGTPPGQLTATPDPATRLIPYFSFEVLDAAVLALRELGFTVQSRSATALTSDPLIIQSVWRGAPVSERVLCGVGTAIGSNPDRVAELSNTLPIELSLGVEVEQRSGRTAARLTFGAQGRRTDYEFRTLPTMPCTLTTDFIDELFDALETHLP